MHCWISKQYLGVFCSAYLINFKNYNKQQTQKDIMALKIDVIIKCIEEIWAEYDQDNGQAFDKDETKKFVKKTLNDISDSEESNDEDIDGSSKEYHKQGRNTIVI